jgi:hypothetical protein
LGAATTAGAGGSSGQWRSGSERFLRVKVPSGVAHARDPGGRRRSVWAFSYSSSLSLPLHGRYLSGSKLATRCHIYFDEERQSALLSLIIDREVTGLLQQQGHLEERDTEE